MDGYIETMVTRRKRPADYMMLCAAGAAGVFLALVAFQWMRAFVVLAVILLGYGFFCLYRSIQVEFEYMLVSDELNIDKIIAQSKRRKVMNVNVRKFDIVAPNSKENAGKYATGVVKVIDCSSDEAAEGTYFAIYNDEKYGRTKLIFTPDERILAALSRQLPRKVIM